MPDTINQARDIALAVLSPSKRDIEHGLELHRHSVVVDAYGFAPRAAVDGDALRTAVKAGASEPEIRDMVENMTMTREVSDPAERDEFIRAWTESGVTCIVQNAGEESQAIKTLIKRLARFIYVTDAIPDFVVKATGPADIIAAKEQGKQCFYLSLNGVPLAEEWRSMDEELRYIETFFQFGCRIMHLTYNRRNMIGDGCMEPANAGLSDFGRAVVREMNRVGVIVDVAHSGWRTSLEAAQTSQAPMVASHSSAVALNAHPRGKPDEVIRAIADTGGYVGVCCVPHFLGRTRDIAALLDHIEYMACQFGSDHVAIGTDTAHTSANYEAQMAKVPERRTGRPTWEQFWPDGTRDDASPEERWRQRLSLAWTNWPLFTVGLVQRGFSDDDIQKIIGGNVLRVADAVLKASENRPV
ncbi:MAG: dipeptidase [Anaerolineae bacterium]|nr:dipeptidase [Anaerolineae bacterium]